MIAGSVAKRYAKALVEAASITGELIEVGEEIQAIASLFKENPEIQALFTNPSVLLADKKAFLTNIMEGVKVRPITMDFLRVVLEKGRISHLEGISRLYRDLVDEKLGRMRATVTTAFPLSEEAQERLRKRLSEITGKDVYLVLFQDSSILGGIITQLGNSIVFDGSLRTQLKKLKEQILKG